MKLKPAVRARILASFLLGVAILATAATLIYRNAQETQETRVLARHTRDVLSDLQALISTVEGAEAGQRGFLITGDENYLASYNGAVGRADGHLSQLSHLLANDSEQLLRVQILQKHIRLKFEEMAATIRLRRSHGWEASRQAVLAGSGAMEMEVIRGLISTMEAEQRQLLEQQRRKFEANMNRTNGLLAVAIGVQFALLLLVFVLFYRDTTHRQYATAEIERSHSRISTILKTMGDGICQLDREGKLVYLNPAGERLLGYKLHDIRGRQMYTLVQSRTPAGRPVAVEKSPLMTVLREGKACAVPQDWFERSDGSFITVEYSGTPLLVDGELTGAVVCFRDINNRLRREEELRSTTELQHAILQSANLSIISTRATDGMITTFNPAAERMLQYSAQEVIGKMKAEMIHDPEEVIRRAAELSEELGLPVAPGREVFTVKAERLGMADGAEWSFIRKDGSRFPVSLSITALRDAEGKINGFMGIAEDITDRKKAEAALRESEDKLKMALEREKDDARIDFLTRIPNRRSFYEIASREANRARRYKRPLTVAYIDLDNFKEVNDSRGHDVGDDLLIEVAATLRTNIRGTDAVARLGGDEFALLLTETGEEPGAMVVQKLHERLLESMRQREWPVTFSIGLITFGYPPHSVDEMVRRADEAMYAAKLQGKNSVTARALN